jgi:hypothetical protein
MSFHQLLQSDASELADRHLHSRHVAEHTKEMAKKTVLHKKKSEKKASKKKCKDGLCRQLMVALLNLHVMQSQVRST